MTSLSLQYELQQRPLIVDRLANRYQTIASGANVLVSNFQVWNARRLAKAEMMRLPAYLIKDAGFDLVK